MNEISEHGLKLLGNHRFGKTIVDPEAIIVRSAKVTLNPSLIAVARAGAGTENIPIKEATERGICAFNTPGGNANSVKELTFISLGSYIRNIIPAVQFVKDLDWNDPNVNAKIEASKSQFAGSELAGKTLAVVGLGKIGVLVANEGVKRGMKVIGYEAFPNPSNMCQLNPKVKIAQYLEQVLAEADVLTVHVPLTEKTKHLIGAKQIVLMKEDCILINYSRGGIYDDAAVLAALSANKLQGFITDFPTKELVQNPKVLCTPHLGASTDEAEVNCAVMAAEQLREYLDYGIVTNSVNFPETKTRPAEVVRTRLTIVSKDAPNMISATTGILGAAGVNIHDLTNKSNKDISYSLVDLTVDIDDELADRIRKIPNVLRVRVLKYAAWL